MKIRTVIIEDEAAARRHLEKLLDQASMDLQVIAVISSVREAISWLQTHSLPDLLFMDIRLSDGLSFTILERCFVDCPIVFTTAYDEYALQAFKTSGIDYLLKPITAEDLHLALNKYAQFSQRSTDWQGQHLGVAQQLKNQPSSAFRERFLLKKGKNMVPVRTEEIAYFYRKDLVFAMTFNGENYLMDESLSHLQQQLSPQNFVRLNRAHLVSLNAIAQLRAGKPGQLIVELTPPLPAPIELSANRSRFLRALLAGE